MDHSVSGRRSGGFEVMGRAMPETPEMERRIRDVAEASRTEPSKEERKTALRPFAQRIPSDTPLLPDESFSRDDLYGGRGL